MRRDARTSRGRRSEAGPPSAPIQVGALLIGIALIVLGNGLQGTLIGVRAGLEGMTAETIGVVMSAYFVGYIGGSLFVPRLVQSVGHIRTFAALASTASAAVLTFAIFVHPVTWVLLRVILGTCYAGLLIVAESWLNMATDRSKRGRILAVYSIVVYGAWAASQPLLELSPPTGFVLFCVVSICLSVALVPITLSRSGIPGVVKASRPSLRRLYNISPLGLAGTFMVGVSSSAFFGMAPTFAQRIGLHEASIAAFISLMLLGALTFQWPLGWLSDRLDRRVVIVLSAVAAALAAIGLAWNTNSNLPLLLVLSSFLGAFALPMYSLCVAHVNDHIERQEVITVASGLILAFGVGSSCGPFAASLLMGRMGPPGLFAFIAAAMLLFAAYGLVDIARRRRVADVDKDPFIAVPETTHAALPLHKYGTGKAKGTRAPR